MRLFRRARDKNPSVIRREAVSATAEAKLAPAESARPSSPRVPVALVTQDAGDSNPVMGSYPSPPPSYDRLEDSDVFVCTPEERAESGARVAREVTLFVHGWHNVEPGLLSWTFPSLRAALDAVQRMKNAIGWCVVSGTGWPDLDSARASGAVLVEQLN
jgi:hypothetical protein